MCKAQLSIHGNRSTGESCRLGTHADISAFVSVDEHLFVATRSLSTATRPFVLLSEHRFGKHCMRDLHLGLYDGVKQHRNVKQ